MKKFILVAAVSFAFAACNSGAGTEKATTPVTDSTKVDSTKTAVETTKAVNTTENAK